MDTSMGDDENVSDVSETDGTSIDLLWKAVVKPNEPFVASRVEDYFLRITNACLGPDVKDNTRSCLTIVQAADEDSEAPGVICTLKNNYENHQLSLLVTDDVQLSVSGENPSPIYLIGYLSPAEQHLGDDIDLDDDLEGMEDEDQLVEAELDELSSKNKQLVGRKRKLAEMEKENDGDEETVASAQKKQKTAGGKAKPQAAQQAKGKNENENKNKNNQNNKQQNPNQKNQNPNQKNQNPNQKNQNPNQKNPNPNQKNPNPNPNQKNQSPKNQSPKTPNPNQKNQNPNQKNKKQQNNTEETKKTTESTTPTATETPTAKEDGKNQADNVNFKDIRAGEGKVIKEGTKVRIYYVGQLQDKKVFDKVIDGDGKEINVGSKDVVDGLEKGLIGMKAGGKRRIVVPAKLAYGEAGDTTKSVPPNSELTYTVEIKAVV